MTTIIHYDDKYDSWLENVTSSVLDSENMQVMTSGVRHAPVARMMLQVTRPKAALNKWGASSADGQPNATLGKD